MAVKIRLQRKGAKHRAFYRVVVADSRSPRDGRFVEQLGFYDPLKDPPDIQVETDKVIAWLGRGAQPTDTVRSLLSSIGIMQMWHEHKRGKPLDELRHFEDDARKKLEAKAAMGTRKKEEAKVAARTVAKEAEKEAAKVAAKDAEAEATEKAAAAEPVEEVTGESDDVQAKPDGGEESAEKPEAGDTQDKPESSAEEASPDDPPADPEPAGGEVQAEAKGDVDGDDTKA